MKNQINLNHNSNFGITVFLQLVLKKFCFFTGLFLCFALNKVYAQLPFQFISKINYFEDVTLSYSMLDSNAYKCLTISEIAQYHGYEQTFNKTEMVDLQGDILTEIDYIREHNVRDEWMESYSKIISGKTETVFYDQNNQILYNIPKTIDSTLVFLTPQQAVNFERYVFNDSFVINAKKSLLDSNVAFTHSNNLLSYKFNGEVNMYDHVSKVLTTTKFDSIGQKISEHIIDYNLVSTEYGYAPVNEIINEWFLTSNNCCIKKTKEILRSNFNRQINSLFTHHIQDQQNIDNLKKIKAASKFILKANTSNNTAIITSQNKKDQLFNMYVYDLSGKLVLQNQVITNQIFTLPPLKDREVAFILKAISVDSKINLSQVILINNNNQF